MNASGGSTVEIAGDVDRQDVEIGGGGDYLADSLESRVAEVELHGGASATVHATRQLIVNASGGGSVSYTGEPELERDLSGGSTLEPQ